MNAKKNIRFGSKNESVIVSKDGREYVVEVIKRKDKWSIYTPVVEIDDRTKSVTSTVDSKISDHIVDEVTKYLSEIKWMGIFRKRYIVEVVRSL